MTHIDAGDGALAVATHGLCKRFGDRSALDAGLAGKPIAVAQPQPTGRDVKY